jgi:hypothetical protein
MRDFLEAVLIGIGVFIICYYGYELIDRIINTCTGIFAICIALFPCEFGSGSYPIGIFQINSYISNILHLITAGIFFALLGFISFFLFTKTDKSKNMTPQKVIRNIIYRVCGIIIAVCGIAIGLSFAFLGEYVMDKYYIVLILEIIILLAFGVSWLVKGEAIFRDKEVI